MRIAGVVLSCLAVVAGCASGELYVRGVAPPCDPCDPAVSQPEAIEHRVILVGDAGEPVTGDRAAPRDDVFGQIRAASLPGRTTMLMLGDNIYPRGLPLRGEAGREGAEEVLARQLALVGPGVQGVVVPGNHDWDRSGDRGLARIVEQAAFVGRFPSGRVRFEPRDGCPGPMYVDVGGQAAGASGRRLRLVFYDSEWLLRESRPKTTVNCTWGSVDSPVPYDPAGTRPLTNQDFAAKLRDIIAERTSADVLLVAHHPLRTEGEHAGKHPWWQNALAYAYPFVRHWIYRSPQDTRSSANTVMRALIQQAAAGSASPVLHASGHEHGLQVFEEPADSNTGRAAGPPGAVYLVSGGGSKAGPLGRADDTVFKHGTLGFMTLDFLTNRRILLRVIEAGDSRPAFVHWIRN